MSWVGRDARVLWPSPLATLATSEIRLTISDFKEMLWEVGGSSPAEFLLFRKLSDVGGKTPYWYLYSGGPSGGALCSTDRVAAFSATGRLSKDQGGLWDEYTTRVSARAG